MTEEVIGCPECGRINESPKGIRHYISWIFGIIFGGVVFLGFLSGYTAIEPLIILSLATVGFLSLILRLLVISNSTKDYNCQDCGYDFYKEKTKENESIKVFRNVIFGMKEKEVRKAFKENEKIEESEKEYLYKLNKKRRFWFDTGNFHYKIRTKFIENKLYEIRLIAKNSFSNFSEVLKQISLLHNMIYRQYGSPSKGRYLEKSDLQEEQAPNIFRWDENDTGTDEIIKIGIARTQNGYKPVLSIYSSIIAKEGQNDVKDEDNFAKELDHAI